ncbi:hypothetical protein BKA81DRAFT_377856 [Phyllosticta paracitricarpa]
MPPRKPKTFLQARTAIAKKQMAKMTNVNTSRAMMANKREFHRRKLEKLEKKQKQRQEREKAETPAAKNQRLHALTLAPPPPPPPQTTAKTRVGEMIELDLAKSTASSLRERGPARGSESEGPRRSAYVPSQAESSVQRMNRLTAESRTAYGSKEFGWDQGGTRAG